MEERTSLFLCAAQDLHAQSDPAVPRPGEDPDEAGVDGRIYHVLSVRVVVKVALEHLRRQKRRDVVDVEIFISNTDSEQNVLCLTALDLKKKSLESLQSSHVYFHGCRDDQESVNQSTQKKYINQ